MKTGHCPLCSRSEALRQEEPAASLWRKVGARFQHADDITDLFGHATFVFRRHRVGQRIRWFRSHSLGTQIHSRIQLANVRRFCLLGHACAYCHCRRFVASSSGRQLAIHRGAVFNDHTSSELFARVQRRNQPLPHRSRWKGEC